ncbi:MAG: subclass B1 metallo-beta-lactamase, long type [Bacteroidales bacterium]
MNKFYWSFILLSLLNIQIFYGQNIKISERLTITKITENSYIHTHSRSNGLIYKNNGEAIIVSTPPSDEVTKELLNWVKEELNVRIVAYVIDRWHPDAMEGLDVVKEFGIKTYSYVKTQEIAKLKNLPIPEIGFDPKLEIKVGRENVICHFLGAAHTTDGIVVWVSKEKVLFGGNEVRNYNGWVGNIADANISEWSNTIMKVKKEYGSAKYVVPGHGKYGGVELLDYTIKLYKPHKWGQILRNHNIEVKKIFNDYDLIFEVAEDDSVNGNIRILKDATVFVDNDSRYFKISSPIIKHNVKSKRIDSEYGRLQSFSKSEKGNIILSDIYYKRLIVNLRDDEVGIEIILKEMIN